MGSGLDLEHCIDLSLESLQGQQRLLGCLATEIALEEDALRLREPPVEGCPQVFERNRGEDRPLHAQIAKQVLAMVAAEIRGTGFRHGGDGATPDGLPFFHWLAPVSTGAEDQGSDQDDRNHEPAIGSAMRMSSVVGQTRQLYIDADRWPGRSLQTKPSTFYDEKSRQIRDLWP